ncbi:type I-F CRISPR-associated protein Csy2 [Gemmatimonas sp.]|uniref:type I-F CRISPR-associated protein Csy2 n=1 Tax=Gemmatimonas sp. TaxID=1962908 RepID=UPI00286E73C3|nr:type I-F CRISPR-associated protein Csy2 [Gemmatimonas sp.]
MNTFDSTSPRHKAVLVIPRIRVQNANAISSPITWGFPAITAFTGLMTALERRLGRDAGMALIGVGVICHAFEAQVTTSGYTKSFRVTRNPVLADGSTAGIVEEGRVHMSVTLVFDVLLSDACRGKSDRYSLAERVAEELGGMRIAGGSVMPPLPSAPPHPRRPTLELVPDEGQSDEQHRQFRRLSREWLPGFALVSRDDVLQHRLQLLKRSDPDATALDAWMDLSRWNTRAVKEEDPPLYSQPTSVEWVTERQAGWIVPIPVGFAALTPLYPPGTVGGARDAHTPFRFVESVWSIGQWVSPHRLTSLRDIVWLPDNSCHLDLPDEHALYRCVNAYKSAVSPVQSAQ